MRSDSREDKEKGFDDERQKRDGKDAAEELGAGRWGRGVRLRR